MGTHISRVKSVDLDVWTPEQMAVRHVSIVAQIILTFSFKKNCQSIQKWGNRLANLYWEAHLRAGHVPPDQYVLFIVQLHRMCTESTFGFFFFL